MRVQRTGPSPASRSPVARLLLAAAGVYAGFGTAARVTTADDPDLPEILQKLDEWRNSFATIRVVWHTWTRQHFIEAHPDLDPDFELGRNYFAEYEFVWADWGAYRSSSKTYVAGELTYRGARGSDGARPWSATGSPGAMDWSKIQYYPLEPDRPLASRLILEALYGIWHSSGFWLNERLRTSQNVTLDRYDELDGHRCAVVSVSRREYGDIRETYWLDTAHGYLPRKYEVLGFLDSGLGPSKELHPWYTWSAVEFRRIDDQTWFPMRGNLTNRGLEFPGEEWTVKTVELNRPVSREFLQAPRPAHGATVVDWANMKGGRIGGSRNRMGSPQASNASQPAGDPSVRAVFSTFPWKWIGLAAAILSLIAVLRRWRVRAEDGTGST